MLLIILLPVLQIEELKTVVILPFVVSNHQRTFSLNCKLTRLELSIFTDGYTRFVLEMCQTIASPLVGLCYLDFELCL